MVNKYKGMDTSKAVIVVGTIIFFLLLADSFIANGEESEFIGQAFISHDESSYSEEVKDLKYFNHEEYPKTPFKETDDYTSMQKRLLKHLETSSFENYSAVVPYQYYIIMPSDLYKPLKASLRKYTKDVLRDTGYLTKILFCDDCSQQEIRATLIQGHSNGLEGALLVGDIPVAWCDFGPYDAYPTPYYYMDLDGVWQDTNQDYIFDTHSGNTEPEIFVSWLKSDNLTANRPEEAILEDYFEKASEYRKDKSSFGFRSLAVADEVLSPVEEGFSEDFYFVEEYNDLENTSADDYSHYMEQEYQSVYTSAHSNPWMHGFSEEDEEGQGCEWYNPPQPDPNAVCYNAFHNYDIMSIYPKSLFYFLCGCASGRFTETDNLANWYIFQPEGGLVAMAPTESFNGGPRFQTYLPHLLDGSNFGESYLDHPDDWTKYTITLFGDPLLHIKEPPFSPEIELEELTYLDNFDDILVNITVNDANSPEFKFYESLIEIKLNGQIVMVPEEIKIPPKGKEIYIESNLSFGNNLLEVCLTSKYLGSGPHCEYKETYGLSSPLVVEESNSILDCDKEGINPRIGANINTGVLIENKQNVIVRNCQISDFFRNIEILNSTNITIEDNYFSRINQQTSTIRLFIDEDSNTNSNISMINNTFHNVNTGISAFHLQDSLIQNNIFMGNSTNSIFFFNGKDNVVEGNFICANTSEGPIQCEGEPVNPLQSVDNNIDGAKCTPDWPIYGEHFLYCDEAQKGAEERKI